MNFGEALQALKEGKAVTRSIWEGYWILLDSVDLSYGPSGIPHPAISIPKIIVASLRDNQGYAVAQPYQTDLLAEDWQIVE